jgi:hypothetical protein
MREDLNLRPRAPDIASYQTGAMGVSAISIASSGTPRRVYRIAIGVHAATNAVLDKKI